MFCSCLIYFLLLSTAFPVLPRVKPPSNAPIANVSGIQNRQLRVSLSGLLQAQVMKMRMAPLPRSSEPWFEYVQRNFPWDDESQPHGLLFLSSIFWIVILLNIQLSALNINALFLGSFPRQISDSKIFLSTPNVTALVSVFVSWLLRKPLTWLCSGHSVLYSSSTTVRVILVKQDLVKLLLYKLVTVLLFIVCLIKPGFLMTLKVLPHTLALNLSFRTHVSLQHPPRPLAPTHSGLQLLNLSSALHSARPSSQTT